MANDNHAAATASESEDPESRRLRLQRWSEQQRQRRENSLRRSKLFYEAQAARELLLLRQAERRKLHRQAASVEAMQAQEDEKPDVHHSDDFTHVRGGF